MSAAALACLVLFGQSGSVLNDEPKFKEKITLDIQNAPITELLEKVSAVTKANLTVPKLVADRKVTIFVEDMPIAQVLDRVADVLMLEWKRDGSAYEITQNPSIGSMRSTYISREDTALRAPAQKQIQKFSQISAQPYGAWLQRRQGIDDAMRQNDASRNPSNAVRSRLQKELEMVGMATDPTSYAAATALRTASIGDLWRGRVFTARVPMSNGGGNLNPRGGFNGNAQRFVFVRFNSSTNAIEYASPGGGSSGQLTNNPRTLPLDTTHPFGKMVADWAKIDTSVNFAPSGLIAVSGSKVMASSALEKLHEVTKLPVIAEGSRQALPEGAGAGSVLEFMRELSEPKNGYLRFQDGVVEFRNADFWRLPATEIPESILRPLESLSDSGSLYLMPYADAVAKLSQPQIDALARGQFHVNFSTEPIARGWPALVLVGQLTKQQRSVAYSGSLVYGQLNGKQQRAVEDAILQSAFVAMNYAGMGLNRIIEASGNPNFLPSLGISTRMGGGANSVSGGEETHVIFGDGETTITYRVSLPLKLGAG